MFAGERDLDRPRDWVMDARLSHPGFARGTGGLTESTDVREESVMDTVGVNGVTAAAAAAAASLTPPTCVGRNAARVAINKGDTPSSCSSCVLLTWSEPSSLVTYDRSTITSSTGGVPVSWTGSET